MIKLTENLCIDADQHQYIVGNPRQRKAEAGGRMELARPQYFTTMASALSAALSRALRMEVEVGNITTLHGFLARQQEMMAELTAQIKSLNGWDAVGQAGGGVFNALEG